MSQTDEVSGSMSRRGTEGRINDLEEILSLQNKEENTLGIRYLTEDITEEIEVPLPSNPDEIPLPSEMPSTRPSSPEPVLDNLNAQLSKMVHVHASTKLQEAEKIFKSPILPPRPTKNFNMTSSNRTLDRLRELNEQMQNEIDLKIDQIKRRKSEIQARKIMIESKLGFLKYQGMSFQPPLFRPCYKTKFLDHLNAAGITHRMVHALRVKQNGRDSMCSFSKPYFLDRRKGGQSTYDQVSDDDNIRNML